MESVDVIVVGAGVLGCFHAYFAARQGCRVLLAERGAWPSEASTRNFGMMPQTIVEPSGEWAEIARDSAEIYRSIQREHDISIAQTGSLYLASSDLERAVLAEFHAAHAERYRCEYLAADEILYRYPFVRREYASAGLEFPDDLSADPSRLLRLLLPWLEEAAGVRYLPETSITSVVRQGGGCVVQDGLGARWSAEHVIICGGSDAWTLFPEVFRESGLWRCKLQMMRLAPPPELRLPRLMLSGLSIRRYPGFNACPSHARLRAEPLAAELAEFDIHLLLRQSPDGSIIAGDSHEYRPCYERGAFEERTNWEINRRILAYARGMVDAASWEVREVWNGYYLMHPEQPAYTAGVDDRIHVVTGIAGKGMTTGPGFARRSVERILA